ncbi:hypothetical protein HPB50_005718 [Hyalomma asiaticum]|uniref:Uncharacterized protein n=1 Tax=Hyalomma asiaticum TaxID=266040 RepID=A0ACB7RUF6_HYAAI|nr:hypothetical protein HPB50_005718 [Hyalomma asiaticum]
MASSSARHGQHAVGVICRCEPHPSCVEIPIADFVTGNVNLDGLKQAALSVDADSNGPRMLEQAAGRRESWKEITRLSLTLMRPERDDNTPAAHEGYVSAMIYFFFVCFFHVVELNLTAFHFTVDAGCAVVVATKLPNLRFLAVTPCAVNHRDSLNQLARHCSLLQELHVMSNRACEACRLPLGFTARSLLDLAVGTKLNQLIVGVTANVPDLSFLEACRVAELWLSVNWEYATGHPSCIWTLGELLRENTCLTRCKLEIGRATVGKRLAEDLSMASSVRHLCVVTTAITTNHEPSVFISAVMNGLPYVRSIHVHYSVDGESVRAMIWPPRAADPEDGLWCDTTIVCLFSLKLNPTTFKPARADEHSNCPVPHEDRRSDVSYKKVGLFNVQGLLLQQNEFDRDKIRKVLWFKPLPGDIFVGSYPRSCSTRAQYIIWSLLPPGISTARLPHAPHQGEGTPRLVKHHLPYAFSPASPEARHVVVLRNPFDVCASNYVHLGKSYEGTFADFFECFTRGEVAFGDYFDHVLSWYDRKDDPRVLLLCYETMRKDPLGSVKLIADFLDIRTNQELISQVARDTGLEATVAGRSDLEEEVLKGRVGCYREYFSKQQHRVLADMTKEKLEDTELIGVWADFLQWDSVIKHENGPDVLCLRDHDQ